MAQCKGCGLKKLEWMQVGGKWVLYDELGQVHKCGQYKKDPNQTSKTVCKHGILKDRWCDRCEEERNNF